MAQASLRRNRYAHKTTEKSSGKRIGRCAIRVSYVGSRGKADQDGKVREEFYSPESQSNAAEAYFKHLGIEYDAETSLRLKDLDRRARKEDSWKKREGLLQHLADAQQGLFTDIAFYKVSRLARNPTDAFAVADEFIKFGVTVHFVRDPLPPLDSINGKIMLAVASTIAQAEAENIADNLSDAILTRWKKGRPHGPAHPWLRKVGNEYFIKEERFPIERRVIEIILQNGRNIDAVRAIRAEGITTVQGKDYNPAHVSRYVSDIYIKNMLGIAVSMPFFDTEIGAERCFKLKYAWPALISEAEADALRLVHAAYRSGQPNSLKTRTWGKGLGPEKLSRYPASGVLFCSICGKPLHATTKVRDDNGKKYGVYFCNEGVYGHLLHVDRKYFQVAQHQADDAILRACFVEAEMPPEPVQTYTPPIKPKHRPTAAIEKDILEWTRKYGEVPEAVFHIRANDLGRELKEAEELEAALAEQPSMEMALEVAENQEVANRILIKSLVKESFYPHEHEGHAAIRIAMKSGREYVAPIHRPTYKRQKKVYRTK